MAASSIASCVKPQSENKPPWKQSHAWTERFISLSRFATKASFSSSKTKSPRSISGSSMSQTGIPSLVILHHSCICLYSNFTVEHGVYS